MKSVYPGVFTKDGAYLTVNIDPGRKVYGERTLREGGSEYRIWDSYRSKLSGALKKGLKEFPFAPGVKVLYLGASTGTTISHLSDILGPDGEIYAVEIAPQCMKSLIALSERRQNIIPIHGDARQPKEYEDAGQVDIIYMDVAQPDQDDILIKNARMFLKPGGIAMIAIKSQSIDVTKDPKVVFEAVLAKLGPVFEIMEKIRLEPFDKDHLFVVLRYRG
ncbi:fibrillarin-like rRNA/tRNA 2'-O-methyltransferase [Candidatus Micrarchaeota archaeon]|nr:fibrillarin-like rRNA/tRNA 2'-O-methyltransferase [Candidatus Micrarchaeota archaeon]